MLKEMKHDTAPTAFFQTLLYNALHRRGVQLNAPTMETASFDAKHGTYGTRSNAPMS
jgi:hypothetical protein